MPNPEVSAARRWLAFVLLFAAYQAPEGIGDHLLHSFPVKAGLMLAFFPMAWAVARLLLGRRPLAAYALETAGRAPAWIVPGFLAALAAKAGAVGIGVALGVHAWPTAASPSPAMLASAFASIAFMTVFPSLAEDILARGYWFRQWPALGRGARFVLFSAAYFVLNHVYRLGNGPMEWLLLFAFGAAYAAALARTGTLWAAFGLHWGWNAAAFLAGDALGIATVDASGAALLSVAAHMVLLGLVLTLPRRAPGA